jgi:hypothetical protein
MSDRLTREELDELEASYRVGKDSEKLSHEQSAPARYLTSRSHERISYIIGMESTVIVVARSSDLELARWIAATHNAFPKLMAMAREVVRHYEGLSVGMDEFRKCKTCGLSCHKDLMAECSCCQGKYTEKRYAEGWKLGSEAERKNLLAAVKKAYLLADKEKGERAWPWFLQEIEKELNDDRT